MSPLFQRPLTRGLEVIPPGKLVIADAILRTPYNHALLPPQSLWPVLPWAC
jgi:hypothetical protein